MQPPTAKSIVRLAAACAAVSVLAGCTASSTPAPSRTVAAAVDARGASTPVVAFGGVSGQLLDRIGNGRTLQWLQVTDSGTAYSTVATGQAVAALVGPRPAGWKTPAHGKALTDLGPVYRAVDAFYSRSLSSAASVPSGATVVLPKDATATAAALRLLAAHGILRVSGSTPTIADVTANPHDLVLVTRKRPVAALKSAALVYLTADTAATAGDALKATAVLAEPKADQQVVSLVVQRGAASSTRVQRLYAELTSASTASWIAKTMPDAAQPVR